MECVANLPTKVLMFYWYQLQEYCLLDGHDLRHFCPADGSDCLPYIPSQSWPANFGLCKGNWVYVWLAEESFYDSKSLAGSLYTYFKANSEY